MINNDDLQFALNNGIIDLAHLQEQINMSKRQEILKRHKYKVSQGKDGRWITYLPDKNGRKAIRKTCREDLEDAIIEYYKIETDKPIRFCDAYNNWRSYRDQMVGENSARKYDTDRIRFFDDRKFFNTNIRQITEDDVVVFIKKLIDELQLCKTATKVLFHYIDNTMEFALRHKYISDNPMKFLHAKDFYTYCTPSKKSQKDKIISNNNLELLNKKFQEDHTKHPTYIPTYAVEFASLTGMRVGEIAAIRWDCVFDDYILIDKSQKYNCKTKEYYYSYTKNGKKRTFPLTEDIKKLLDTVKRIESENDFLTEYVFSDKDGPLNFRKISYCLKSKCRSIGIDTMGIHAFRRTVNSIMSNDGVPTSVRASLLGHSKEVNEQYYTFDVSTNADKIDIISSVNKKMISA